MKTTWKRTHAKQVSNIYINFLSIEDMIQNKYVAENVETVHLNGSYWSCPLRSYSGHHT